MALGTTSISTDVVKAAIGESSDDVGTLCKSLNVAKWAKYRPFHWTKASSDEDTLFKDLTSGDNWMGPSLDLRPDDSAVLGSYKWIGFTPLLKHVTDTEYLDAIASAYNNQTSEKLNGWVFNAPSGGFASPYRLGDFRLYEHSSTNPFLALNCTRTSQTWSGDTVEFWVYYNTGSIPYGIGPKSFPALNDMYFGVLCKSAAPNSNYLLYTSSTPWDDDSDDGNYIDLTIDSAFALYYSCKFYPVLSNIGGLTGIAQTGSVRPIITTLPGVSAKSLYIDLNAYRFETYAYYEDGGTHVDFYLVLIGGGDIGTVITISSVKIYYDGTESFPSSISDYTLYTGQGQTGYDKIYYDCGSNTYTRTQKASGFGDEKDIVRANVAEQTFVNVKSAATNTRYLHVQFTLNNTTYRFTEEVVSPEN